MRIEVYPSLLPGQPLETHQHAGTLGEWLRANVKGYASGEQQPIAALVDGHMVPPAEWGALRADVVELRVLPQGGSLGNLLNIIFPFLGFQINAIMGALIPNMPKAGSRESQQIAAAEARANQVKINGIIPEGFGLWRRYPDYLVSPHRYYVNRTEQWLDLCLCVGRGRYQMPLSQVLLGDTPALTLGAVLNHYEPGADLSADPAAQWWHSAPEVGGTSTGNAGLELAATFEVDPNPDASSYAFAGVGIGIPAGSGEFPEDWESGMLVRVVQFDDYEVESPAAARSIIRGPLEQLGIFAGMVIEVAGPNEGQYVVDSYTPAVPGDAGSASGLTGSAAPARFDFDVTPASFVVSLGPVPQTVTLVANVVDMTGLLLAINGQISGLEAVDAGGVVEITESAAFYTGEAITVLGDFTDVLGVAPVGTTGDATTVTAPAEMTLDRDDGAPVVGLVAGAQRMAIGYRGMRYRMLTVGTSAITLERLTDTGADDLAWPGFDPVVVTDAVVQLDDSERVSGWAGPFAGCPEGETTSAVEIDLLLPSGLIRFNDEGKRRPHRVDVEIQWRDMEAGGAWTSQTEEYRERTIDQLGFTVPITLPVAMRPEFRLRKIPYSPGGSGGQVQDDVKWTALKTRLQAPVSYEGVTVLTVSLRGSDRNSAQSENQISALVTRILPVLVDGEWGPEQPTRDISAAVGRIMRSIGREDQIDLAELARLQEIWTARGDTFDFFHDGGTVRDALNTALGAGMATTTVDMGRIRPVRDEPRTQWEQMYTPQNMTGPLRRQWSGITPSEADGVDVEYMDASTWTKQTVECRLPGDLGERAEKITLDGVVDRARAWRVGMRRRREIAYRRWGYSFNTELDALNSRYLSYVALGDDIPGYGKSALLVGIEADSGGQALISVSEPFEWDSGADHVVALRAPDGRLLGPWPATPGPDEFSLYAPVPEPFPAITLKQELPHVLFGTTERWTFPALITEIKPQGFESTSVTAANYDPRVYADDDNTPPD